MQSGPRYAHNPVSIRPLLSARVGDRSLQRSWPLVVSVLDPIAAVLPQDAGAPRIFSGANSARSQRYYIALLLTSFAVGLLIVFRTNSSYAR